MELDKKKLQQRTLRMPSGLLVPLLVASKRLHSSSGVCNRLSEDRCDCQWPPPRGSLLPLPVNKDIQMGVSMCGSEIKLSSQVT
jgi:hypothetical protein